MLGTSGNRLATVFLVLVAVNFFSGRFSPQKANADVLGTWYDDNGNPISLPQAVWNATTPEGSVTVSYGGVTFTGLVGHVTFPASPLSSVPAGSSFSWSNPFNWDSWIIPVAWSQNSWESMSNGDLLNLGTTTGLTSATLDAVDNFLHGGPSQTSVSVPLPLPPGPVQVNLGTTVRFNVTIDGSRTALLDQNATLDSLSVEAGSTVAFQPGYSMILRAGTSQNAGTITQATMSIQNGVTFNNTGNFEWIGGTFAGLGTVVNQGNFNWTMGGILVGNLVNEGSLTFTSNNGYGSTGPLISSGGVLTNAGTISHTAGYQWMNSTATLNNLAGAVYNFQGAGNIQCLGSSPATINNAGTFCKSAGTATASITNISFNNTGTVEVDAGTLSIDHGSSAAANYQFTNGGQLNASFTWQGANAANGNGVLAIGGSVAAGTVATFASSQFTNGAALQVGAGATGDLNVGSGATLTLNMTGAQQATMLGGNLHGVGTTINLGNFVWSGGNIGDSSSGTVVNQGNFNWTMGGILVGNLVNEGSLTFTSNNGYGSTGPLISSGGVLTNAGTISHTAGYQWMNSTATLNNLAGAVYNFQGAGNIQCLGSSPATINNAGTFCKSAGTATASITNISFNNTGTVEVDAGTLSIDHGSSAAANYQFTNGGQLNASFTWQGANAANGNGVLAIGGSVAAGTVATFASSQFTNGAALQVGAGATGDLNVGSGATLTLNMTGAQQATMLGGNLHGVGTTINLGNFVWSGGNIGDSSSGTVVNQGNFNWTMGGILVGNLVNEGSLTFTSNNGYGSTGPLISSGGVLTNAGTISHTAGYQWMNSTATLNNLAGAVYNFQGAGNIQCLGSSPATINNAGTFCKSAGTATASITNISFNNTGTVEVDAGTLSIDHGSSAAANYQFTNGGQLNASFTWQGANAANGNGVLAIGGSVAAGTVATFASSQFTNGAALQVGAGATGDLNVGSGATLTLNMTGAQQATMLGGNLHGVGTTINLGNFVWSGGNIGDSSSGTVVNQGNFNWTMGGILVGNLVNEGSLTFTSNNGYGSTGPLISSGGVLTNAGTISHTAGYQWMNSTATLNNLAGAVYNFQGAGNIQCLGSSPATINNAGTFCKSAGTATASITNISFNNTGTVEVDAGTLSIDHGSSAAANYQFTNGGQLNASFTWQGANAANGNGVLAIGGSVAAGTVATFASSQFTNGAALQVGAGATGDLNVGSGATLTLNMTGAQQATMLGGNLHGVGTTINLGNFVWSGGNIGDSSSGTVVNQGNFNWTMGGILVGNLVNEGSLTFTSNNGYGSTGPLISSGGVLTNAGTISHTAGYQWMNSTATLNNLAGAVYNFQGAGNIQCLGSSPATINNAGTFCKSAGTATASITNISFNNTGTVEVDAGTLSFASSFTQTAGSINLNGGSLMFSSSAQILGGEILGSGTINGSVVNSSGLLSPGHSPGSLILNGNYTEGAAGALLIELGGLGSGQFDYLDVDGTDSLGGTLEIGFLDRFHPMIGNTFHIMDFNSRTGDFASIQVLGSPGYQFTEQYSSSGLTLVTQSVPEPGTLASLLTAAFAFLCYAYRQRMRRGR